MRGKGLSLLSNNSKKRKRPSQKVKMSLEVRLDKTNYANSNTDTWNSPGLPSATNQSKKRKYNDFELQKRKTMLFQQPNK